MVENVKEKEEAMSPEEQAEAGQEEYIFPEEEIKPKWFKNKTITIIGIIGIVLLIATIVFFVNQIWPSLYEIIKGKNALHFYGDNYLTRIRAEDQIYKGRDFIMGQLVYLELLGIPALVCIIIFVLSFVGQVMAKKRQISRKNKLEKKFYKEKERIRKMKEEAVAEANEE